ncbi:hypothetical protein Btru_067207 [Bulinus truncatus]|nr:hypothetical protein Btru_067207 [Bulinus truncatus]
MDTTSLCCISRTWKSNNDTLREQSRLISSRCPGRTAIDFASALDSIWAFFAAAGCKRAPKDDLIKMNIIKKTNVDNLSKSNELLELKCSSKYSSQEENNVNH